MFEVDHNFVGPPYDVVSYKHRLALFMSL